MKRRSSLMPGQKVEIVISSYGLVEGTVGTLVARDKSIGTFNPDGTPHGYFVALHTLRALPVPAPEV